MIQQEAKAAEWFAQAEHQNGAWRWKSNGNIPFDDMLADFRSAGLITAEEEAASNALRKTEADSFFVRYAEAQAARSQAEIDEERAEMLAAFGPGETIVNVITGERTVL